LGCSGWCGGLGDSGEHIVGDGGGGGGVCVLCSLEVLEDGGICRGRGSGGRVREGGGKLGSGVEGGGGEGGGVACGGGDGGG